MKIKVAVIDDGINSEVYMLNTVAARLSIVNQKLFVCEDQPGIKNHSTNCAAIIEKYARVPIEIISIKILNEYGQGNVRDLIKAIQYCSDNQIDIVNISCGTTNDRDGKKIKKYFSKLKTTSNVVYVAAQSNKPLYTYPACLPQVIGVRSKLDYWGNEYNINLLPYDGVEIEASSRHILHTFSHEKICTYSCNSYAAPMICGLICNIIYKYNIKDKKEILNTLQTPSNCVL